MLTILQIGSDHSNTKISDILNGRPKSIAKSHDIKLPNSTYMEQDASISFKRLAAISWNVQNPEESSPLGQKNDIRKLSGEPYPLRDGFFATA